MVQRFLLYGIYTAGLLTALGGLCFNMFLALCFDAFNNIAILVVIGSAIAMLIGATAMIYLLRQIIEDNKFRLVLNIAIYIETIFIIINLVVTLASNDQICTLYMYN